MKIKFLLLIVVIGIVFSGCHNKNNYNYISDMKYPATKKCDQADDYFGTKVADPYRWLENDTSAETGKWVEMQNKVTTEYFSKIPYREKIKKRLTDLSNYPKYGSPYRAGEYYFFSKNDGLQNQYVTYYHKGLDGKPEVFLDPNTLSKDGTVSAHISSFSKDRKYITYSVSKSGSDWEELFIMDVATKKQSNEKLTWIKFPSVAWFEDGFFYSRYPKPDAGKELSAKNEDQSIWYHKIGESQDKDKLIYQDKKHPLRYLSAQTTLDERYLFIYVSEGNDGSEILYKDLSKKDKDFKPLFTGFDITRSIIENIDDKLIVHTNCDAPKYKVVLVDPKNPEKENWKTIIPEKDELLEGVGTANNKLFTTYLKDVCTKVYQYDYSGKLEREINLPGLGVAYGFGGEKEDTFLFYTFTSYNYPPTIFKYDIASGKSDVFRKSEVKFNPEDYMTKQVFYPSKDGTKIPMFIVHKKGLKLDGNNPTLLYAYGGFNINMTPYFSSTNIVFMENGGVYAVANLRGGGEYGEDWHKAGRLLKKQNVFDDFIAGAEYLIKEKYTSKDRLAIEGGSNGGLLVGACMTQRPDLFKVVIPEVGVMDMLRFHKFTVGWGWVDEYGSSDSSKYFKYLYGYSPLHNIKNIEYPATLVCTADHDDRVVPAHSFKFIATLQEKVKGNNPALIRIETKSGHGGGKSLTKYIEEAADIWSFVFFNMGVDVKY